MAKLGAGDDRWIVEDKGQAGTNVRLVPLLACFPISRLDQADGMRSLALWFTMIQMLLAVTGEQLALGREGHAAIRQEAVAGALRCSPSY